MWDASKLKWSQKVQKYHLWKIDDKMTKNDRKKSLTKKLMLFYYKKGGKILSRILKWSQIAKWSQNPKLKTDQT